MYAEDKSGVGGMEPNRVVVDNKDVTTQEQAELSSCKSVYWMRYYENILLLIIIP